MHSAANRLSWIAAAIFLAISLSACVGHGTPSAGVVPSTNGTALDQRLTGPLSMLPDPRAIGQVLSEPALVPTPVNVGYKLFYRFQGGTDGEQPNSLIAVKGVLFGTTGAGGTTCPQGASFGVSGCGTIFRVRPSGKEDVLYRFTGGTADGALPDGLMDLNGELYGGTGVGGDVVLPAGCNVSGCGTIFEKSTSSKERIVYNFQGSPTDGEHPDARLVAMNGTLYGATAWGGLLMCPGNVGCGTVFEVSPSGAEKVLYSFKGGADGFNPAGTLIARRGRLYGTTQYGGGSGCGGYGCGTVFEVSTSGAEHVLHTFKGGSDGCYPYSMIILDGVLYGTTDPRGSACGGNGNGTIFKLSTSGVEHVLYRFKGSPDGALPFGLTALHGVLYGATEFGGIQDRGTVYSLSTSGKERVLYSFKGPPDGAIPNSLLAVKGTLYGTTADGGSDACVGGCGTVFKLTP